MKTRLFILAVCLFSIPAYAGELVRDAIVVEVANTYNNGADFAVRLEGGTGICSAAIWIVFPESKKQSVDSYQQAFAIALSALTTGTRVRVHNFEDDSCDGANFISITNAS